MKPLTVHDLKLYGFKNLGMVNDFRVYCKNGLYVAVKKGKFKSFSYGEILDCNPTFESLELDAWFNFGNLAPISRLITVSNLEWYCRFEIGQELTKHEVVVEKEKTKRFTGQFMYCVGLLILTIF